MRDCKKNLVIAFFCLLASVIGTVSAQKTPDSITLFQGPNGIGAGQPIPPGTYRVDGKQIAASLGKDAVISVGVPASFNVHFCNVEGKCDVYSAGTHNLRSTNFVLIKVWRDLPSIVPVVVFEAENWTGRSQAFPVGMYRSIRNEFGNIGDDKAVSVVVASGFRARFCVDEGMYARGAGDCEEHNEGRHNLRFSTSISFIEVIDLSDTSPPDESMPVVLYEDQTQGGKRQGFDIGVYVAAKGQFGKVLDDSASSVTVKNGYRVTICVDEKTVDRCEDLGPGKHNLKNKDSASYMKVSKSD